MRFLKSSNQAIAYYSLGHALHTVLISAFEMAFLLRLFQSLPVVLALYMLYYLSLFAFFAVGMLLLKTGKAHRGFRLDLLCQILTALWAFFCFSRLGSLAYLMPYFLFRGASEGFYWSSRHCSVLDSVRDADRDSFFMRIQSLQIALAVVLPLGGAFLISLPAILPGIQKPGSPLPPGYAYLFLGSGLLSVAVLALSPKLSILPQSLRLTRIAAAARSPKTRLWIRYQTYTATHMLAAALCGALLNVGILRTEANIGLFASSVALASALVFWTVGKALRGQKTQRMAWTLAGCAGDALSRFLYAVFYSYPVLIVKVIMESFLSPLKAIFGENVVRRKIEEVRNELSMSSAEGFFFQEAVIFLGRMALLGAGLWWSGSLGSDGLARSPVALARAALPFFALAVLGDYFFLRAINRSMEQDRYRKRFLKR
jgi:hypothetical protein